MPIPNITTTNALIALPGNGSLRGKCKALGLDESWRGTIDRILSGEHVSREKENEVRRRLGLYVRQPRRFYRPCLSVELGEALQGTGIDIEATLWKELNRRHAASCR